MIIKVQTMLCYKSIQANDLVLPGVYGRGSMKRTLYTAFPQPSLASNCCYDVIASMRLAHHSHHRALSPPLTSLNIMCNILRQDRTPVLLQSKQNHCYELSDICSLRKRVICKEYMSLYHMIYGLQLYQIYDTLVV